MKVHTVLALALTAATDVHAFFRMECQGRVGLGRIDPLMAPGKPAKHLHSISGSNGFSMDATYDDLRNGDCTSCRVRQDKSAYWHPPMYFQDGETGEFELVEQVGGMLAYYQYHLDELEAFPPGFRMIAGDTLRRNWTTWDPSKPDPVESEWTSLGIETQESYKERSIGFNCLNYAGQDEPTLYRHFLPEKDFIDSNCPNGIRTEINFPSCWNGEDRDSDDHQSHVAYPDRIRSGNCPEGFSHHLPNLLFEVVWKTSDFDGRKGRFVMSNGDALGYGYHGDFMAGWDEDFLQQVLETCTNNSGDIRDCPLFDIVSEEKAKECEMNIPDELKDEKVEGPLELLPGKLGILWEDHTEYPNGEPPKEDDTPDTPELEPNPNSDHTAPVVAEPSTLPANPLPAEEEPAPAEEEPVAAEEPLAQVSVLPAQESVEVPEVEDPDTDVNAADVDDNVDDAPVPEFPETTQAPAAPEPDLLPAEDKAFYSTEVKTQGKVVSIIYWEEETVYVTEYEDTTTTVTVTGEARPAKRHIHQHQHAHGHHRYGRFR